MAVGAGRIAVAALNSRLGRRTLLTAGGVAAVTAAAALSPVVGFAAVLLTPPTGQNPTPGPSNPVLSGGWTTPLVGDYYKGRGFGYNPVDGCGYCSVNHQGYDMSQGCGTVIHAAGPGTVIVAEEYQGYGNAVLIDHGQDVVTLYGHMQWGSLRVTRGQQITAGTPLGAEGNTGKSFGCHLHFEVRIGGNPTDPEPFMAARGLHLK
ncbi:murein DD-endopeptidase MepM/ murein hydrolase activator NlpD [Microbacterium sp. SLBN-111]